jgi:5-methylcytosine-specific restriction protein B
MKVDRINFYKEHFRTFLSEDETIGEAYKYDALEHFQSNWDLGAIDLKEMFDRSLSAKISGRLWSGSTHSPKSVMLEFIELNREFVRSTFRDLFDDSKDVVMRMQRFSFHCDVLLKEIYSVNKKLVSHKHNPRMVSVYLSLRYPDKYTVYDYKTFTRCMGLFESANLPLELEIDKFFRLCDALYKIITKDDTLVALHQKRIESLGINYIPSHFIVHDFLEYVASNSHALLTK